MKEIRCIDLIHEHMAALYLKLLCGNISGKLTITFRIQPASPVYYNQRPAGMVSSVEYEGGLYPFAMGYPIQIINTAI